MTTVTNNMILRRLMQKHRLSCKAVAELLGRSPKTIRNFRCANGPQIPNTLLELLELKLGYSNTKQGSAA